MKKVLLQLGQWISRNKKKLIYGALALFVGQICFFGLGGIGVQNEVFAADGNEKSAKEMVEEKITEMEGLARPFQKVIYVLIYPLLMIAGVLVDNSLVYGEIFGFDTVLWKLWIIMRNIADFALGFIFIFFLFKFLKPGGKQDWSRLIIRSLIAGIGIQASWFIMAALIDISTIVTYGVGGLPISVLGTEDNEALKYNPYVLNTVISIDADDVDSFDIFLSDPGKTQFISQCEFITNSYSGDNNQTETRELILAPQSIYMRDGDNCYSTVGDKCHIGDQVYTFADNKTEGYSWNECGEARVAQSKYNEQKSNIKSELGTGNEEKINESIGNGTLLVIGVSTGNGIGLDEGNESIGASFNSPRLSEILSGSYVGVFGALYGSLLNAGADMKIIGNDNIYVKLLNAAISLGHVLAVNIPLIVMLVVFVIRICVLWMAIVLSPIIVLLKVFDLGGDTLKMIGSKDFKFLEYLTVKNLIGIIFSPAIVCFAISMSTVLIRIINNANRDVIYTEKTILGGLIRLNIAGAGVSLGKLVAGVLGIAVAWFLMWAAIKASAIGKSEKIQKLKEAVTGALGAMPIIPVPTKDGKMDFVGAGTIFGHGDESGIISKQISNVTKQFNDESNEAFNQMFKYGEGKQAELKANSYWNNLQEDWIKPGGNLGNWINVDVGIGPKGDRTSMRFVDLPDNEKEKIIENINNQKSEVRKRFGALSSVNVGGKTYIFVTERPKVDGQGNQIKDDKGQTIMEPVYKYEVQK